MTEPLERPWRARPMDPTDSRSLWEVVAPSRWKRGWVTVATHLTERDARDIAAAGRTFVA